MQQSSPNINDDFSNFGEELTEDSKVVENNRGIAFDMYQKILLNNNILF